MRKYSTSLAGRVLSTMRTIRENCDAGGLGNLSPTGPW
jgi:hypothetical protein